MQPVRPSEGIPEFLVSHTHQRHVAEVQKITARTRAGAVKLPAADDVIEQTTRIAQPHLAFTKGQKLCFMSS